jgi:hypothetical protein
VKFPDTNILVLIVVAIVNVCATTFLYLKPSVEREGKLWQLYTASVTGLYGYVLANDRLISRRVKQAEDRHQTSAVDSEIDGNL